VTPIELRKKEFDEAQRVLQAFYQEQNWQAIASAGALLVDTLKAGHKVISCGNGGSMSDAMHFAEELSGRFREDRPALAAVAISDPAHLSCVANDYGYARVFSRYVEGLGQPGDVLLAISTSGNSENVCLAAEAARAKGMKVIALTGKTGGKLAGLCDIEIRSPESAFADRVQEIHIKVIHTLILYVERQISA